MRAMAVAGVRSPLSERKYAPTSASPASTVSPTPFNRVPRSTAACKIVPECFAVMSPVWGSGSEKAFSRTSTRTVMPDFLTEQKLTSFKARILEQTSCSFSLR